MLGNILQLIQLRQMDSDHLCGVVARGPSLIPSGTRYS
jgi:hypothetical protein